MREAVPIQSQPKEQYRSVEIVPLSGGYDDTTEPQLLADSKTPSCRNVEFNRGDVRSARGSIKFNNQTAPTSGIRTRVDPALSPLSFEAGKSVPLRGYIPIPYRDDYDIGGDFGSSGTIPTQEFHGRRGRDFILNHAFTMPAEAKLYGKRTAALSGEASLPADTNVLQFVALGGYDEALDECTILAQKGGDKTAPMSWALGIVNVGDRFEYITGASTTERPSNYALVFMWYDAPEWAGGVPSNMRYKVGTGAQPDVGIGGSYCTLAYRAIVASAWLEPGKRYSATVQLKLDTGTTGGNVSNPSANWNADGSFKIVLQEVVRGTTTVCDTLGTNLYVWKGPTDSYDYLTRYGVRYSGRDMMFLGLGYRMAPWKEYGWIPFGQDSASLERGGFSMTSVGDTAAMAALTLTAAHTSGDAYVVVNHRALINGNTVGGFSPLGPNGASWGGIGDGVGALYNADSLRNYHLVIWNQATTQLNGVRLKIGSYSEVGASYRLACDLTTSTLTWAAVKASVQAFRWHQREIIHDEFRIGAGVLDFTNARTLFALRAKYDTVDDTDTTHSLWKAVWPLDDSGGGVCRELIGGRSAFLAPFSVGVAKEGETGRVFLSGEGEALTLDFTSDPVLKREVTNMLQSGTAGFAVQVTCELPEAIYAVDEASGGNFIGKYAPTLISWEVSDPERDGFTQQPYPLLELTQRCIWATFTTPVRRPMGFMARVSTGSDQEAGAWNTVVTNWDNANGFYWDENAVWVGKRLTFQVGIQSTGTADTYVAYVAFGPKTDLSPNGTTGDSARAEAAYFTGSITIKKKDLLRSVITIGGKWDPKNAGQGTLGYSEMNARMIVEEVRVFGASAPGGLPTTSGLSNTNQDGKLYGNRCLPAGVLRESDILRPVGDGQVTVNVSEGSTTVSPSGQTRFFTAEARTTIDAIKNTYLMVLGDKLRTRDLTNGPQEQDEGYFVSSLAAGGASLTLKTAYNDASRRNAAARSVRLIGYTAFQDDTSQKSLTLGRGSAFVPGTTTTDDVVMTDDWWVNLAPFPVNWRLRVYSPIGQSSINRIVPKWTRGVRLARRNPILGLPKQEGKLYAITRGAIYRVDDRWKNTGPTPAIRSSLSFLGQRDPVTSVMLPRAADYVRFGTTTGMTLTSALLNGSCFIYDCWVKLRSTGGIQTIEQVVSESTNPQKPAGTHRMHLWTRLNEGRPEFVLGSTAAYTGSTVPEKGFYVCTGATALKVGVWTHLRWYVSGLTSGTQVSIPKLKINGRTCTASVNAWAAAYTGSTTVWLDTSTLVSPGSGGVVMIGSARDAALVPESDSTFTETTINGEHLRPNYVQGITHTLDGDLAGVVVSQEAAAVGTAFTDFDPLASITYASKKFAILDPAAYAVGHKVYDSGGAQYGVIHSHPFLSLFHELGNSTEMPTWAAQENRLYGANGGRPFYVDGDFASFVGVLPPSTKCDVTVERLPLWQENKFTASDPENDPIAPSAVGTTPVYHFQSFGNNFWKQAASTSMKWAKDCYWAWKGLVRFRNVSGRIPIVSARDGASSGGPFLECRDGRVVFGWWDTEKKAEQTVETNVPVLQPGFVYYLHIRKLHPNSAPSAVGIPAGSGGWRDSVVEQTASYCLDTFVVRQMMKEAPAASYSNYPTYSAKTNGTIRNAVSFTTDLEYTVAGCTMTGLVSSSTRTFTGAAAGVVNATAGAPFHADMVGMYWQWGNASDATVYRITQVNTTAQITTVNAQTGVAASFAAAGYNTKTGGVFTGIRLIKSTNFASARNPDESAYDMEMFGSFLARDPISGITPFDGKWYSAAWYVVSDTDGQNVDIFENDRADEIETGSDVFEGPLYTGATAPNELVAVGGNVFGCVNTRPAAGATTPVSSQPNEDLKIDMDTEASVLADPVYWQYVEDIDVLSGITGIRVAFFDPAQPQISNPGPQLTFQPSGEDRSNPSAQARFLISEIPVSRESDRMQRQIYMTTANGGTFFKVADVPDNEASAVAVYASQGDVTRGQILAFDNAPPPSCKIVAASQSCMVYAAMSDQPDGFRYSKPFFPASVPFANFDIFASGQGTEITGAADLKGRLLLWKRDAMRRAVIRDGVVIGEDVATSAGCIARQGIRSLDNRIYYPSDRGINVYTGSGQPVWVSPGIEKLYTQTLDKSQAFRASACLNRSRNQYLITATVDGVPYTNERVSLEFDHEYSGAAGAEKMPAMHRASRYKWPIITALGNADRDGGGVEQTVAGTEDGFVIYLDRDDSDRTMLGGSTAFWGNPSATANGASTSSRVMLSALALDTDLEGCRGAPVEWKDASGNRLAATALLSDASSVWLDRVTTNTLPASGAAVTVGAIDTFWETGWLNFGTPFADKKLQHIDIAYTKTSGTLTVELLGSYDEATILASTANETPQLNLATNGPYRWTLQKQHRTYKLRFRFDHPVVDSKYIVTSLVFRFLETEQQ